MTSTKWWKPSPPVIHTCPWCQEEFEGNGGHKGCKKAPKPDPVKKEADPEVLKTSTEGRSQF
jgi:hypothetical protein